VVEVRIGIGILYPISVPNLGNQSSISSIQANNQVEYERFNFPITK